jgi:phosphatidylglycerol:prolipoprotein diacylglycerol transferase
MWHTLFTIYGPISIHSYGLMIAIGLLVFLYFIKRNPRFHALKLEGSFMGILLTGIMAGLLGGRFLFLVTAPETSQTPFDLIAFWQGGFRILGAVIAIILILPLYLSWLRVPIVPLLDLLAIYAPMLQSISRIGCFLAGCCHGIPTTHHWGIIYTDAQSAAPLYVCLHPTQLYSAIALMIIFAAMYFFFQHRFHKPGQLISTYIALVSLERFLIDFWRGDRESSPLFLSPHMVRGGPLFLSPLHALRGGPLFSLDQQIAIALFIAAIIGLIITTFYRPRRP